MDWSDLAPIVGVVAPTLGRLLGGALPIPFGGEVGSALGQAIAGALGVEANPSAVAHALGSTPNDVKIAQLSALEAEAQAKWKALADLARADASVGAVEVQTTATTIQAELVSGAWYQRWWRPCAMYVWIGSWPFQLFTILNHISTKDPATIAGISGLVYALCAWNATPAALAGVYAYGRSQEKIAAIKDA